MLGDWPTTALNYARNWTSAEQAGSSKTLQQETAVQLQQVSLQAALAHRERIQQVEGLQAHPHSIRQAGAKLLGFCLPCRRSCMVDPVSPDPSTLWQILS